MIKDLNVTKYKKLRDIKISFNKNLNIISGANGTCKSSILYLVSNSYQEIKSTNSLLIDSEAITNIRRVSSKINPKIEWLTRGDKTHNDPTNGLRGTVYAVNYLNEETLEFRKHNSSKNQRYALKPKYIDGQNDSLPSMPIIYQSLSRLHPFGEYQLDDEIKKITGKLPVEYIEEVNSLYKMLTNMDVKKSSVQAMGSIKKRTEFFTDDEGIDSNTISSGEDNLYSLLMSLVSLRYYSDSIKETILQVKSIYLIDEFDASLHPSLQVKLMKIFSNYSEQYGIQIILTTHSIDLLDYALKKDMNVIYLVDNINSVAILEEPDIYKIRMHLKGLIRDEIYENRIIPVFTEDKEARIVIFEIFEYFEKIDPNFSNIVKYFHFINSNFSSESLINIFTDKYLQRTTIQSICILDGDQKTNLSNSTITLPGNDSPEEMVFKYAEYLSAKNQEFWEQQDVLLEGFGNAYYRSEIAPSIQEIEAKIKELKQDNKSTKGVTRDMNKKLFNKNLTFFKLVLKYWLEQESNQQELNKFYNDLFSCFKKVSGYHQINPKEWKKHDLV